MEPFVFPLITVASLVVIVLAYRWQRHIPASKGFVSAAFGLVAFAGSAAVVDWAVDDQQRLTALLAVMLAVVVFSGWQVVRRRSSRRRPRVEESGRRDFL